jgi:glycosyltransferase involved in cell wall biosynthesis
MSGSPAITVLMPVFNGARHLAETLESLNKQSFSDFEILLINDGSTDNSMEIARASGDSRLRIVSSPTNIGLVASLNRGLAEAQGVFVARQDADDPAHKDRLDQQIQFLRGNPSVPLLGSDATVIDDTGRWCGRWRTGGSADLVRWDCGFRTPFAHSSAMFRRDIVWDRFGGYRDCRACEDLDLWGRVAAEFPVVTLPIPLISYRQHAESVMAGEHAGAGIERSRAIHGILHRNLTALAPGTPQADIDCIADVWSQPVPCANWERYFAALHDVRLGFLRGHRRLRGMDRILADQHYMLACRMPRPDRSRFLAAMLHHDRRVFFRMPWARLTLLSLRK